MKKQILVFCTALCWCSWIVGQSVPTKLKYGGIFIGSTALTGVNLPNWAGRLTATQTPLFSLNGGVSFSTSKGLLIDFLPLIGTYTGKKFSLSTGLFVRYYLK